MKPVVVAECFSCNKNIYEGAEYYEWGEAYCSSKRLEDCIKNNMSDVIDQIAEVKIG